jgi:hypothetical protein
MSIKVVEPTVKSSADPVNVSAHGAARADRSYKT